MEKKRGVVGDGLLQITPEDHLRFEYEALTTRLYTRETSTLTIATLTTAGALAFLAIVVERGVSDKGVYLLGLFFASVGILYRELTLFTIDRKQLFRIRQIEGDHRIFPNGIPTYQGFWTYFRWFIFRCVILSPVVGFLRYLGLPAEIVIVFGLLVPLFLTVTEYGFGI